MDKVRILHPSTVVHRTASEQLLSFTADRCPPKTFEGATNTALNVSITGIPWNTRGFGRLWLSFYPITLLHRKKNDDWTFLADA